MGGVEARASGGEIVMLAGLLAGALLLVGVYLYVAVYVWRKEP